MSNVIKFPAALKMLAATSGCPSRLILGDEKISSRIIVDLKRETITITINLSEHCTCQSLTLVMMSPGLRIVEAGESGSTPETPTNKPLGS